MKFGFEKKKFFLKLLYFVLGGAFLGGLLSNCQAAVSGETVAFTASVTPTAGVLSPPLTPSLPAQTPTLLATPVPTHTPIPPTATPFVCDALHGVTESGEFLSEAMREDVRYLVHLPPCYEYYADKAFPVLYLFHGWPLDEQHWDSMGADELADDWISRQIIGPFILVLPGVSDDGLFVNSSGGDNSFEGMVTNELVPLIDQSYRTLREPLGRAIGGVSRGGVWAISIAFRHQDVFGILGGHSPALALNRPLPKYDPFLLAKEDLSGLRVYLDAGDADWARGSTIQLRDLLEENGVDVTYQLHVGAHVDELWSGAMGDYLDFYTLPWPRFFDDLPLWEPYTPEPQQNPAP